MNLVQENWNWISSNPWAFASVAISCLGLGWAGARLFYSERIELLKAKADNQKQQAPGPEASPAAYSYPINGRHGRNLLSNSTHEVCANEPLSLRAEVPVGSKLHLVLRGLPPIYLEDTSAGWACSIVTVVNWLSGDYRQDMKTAEQHFDAESGVADLRFFAQRTGELAIDAYEGTDQSPTWSKVVQVRPERRASSAGA